MQIGVYDGWARLENGKNGITRWPKGKTKKISVFTIYSQPLENHDAAKNQKNKWLWMRAN